MNPHFFGTEADLASADPLRRAWALRQRDDEQAAALARTALADPDAGRRGRAHLVLAEVAFLQNDGDATLAELDAARRALAAAGDAAGLGDADLIEASHVDQAGGDRHGPLARGLARYREAGDDARERIAATWLACLDATADPDAAQARWGHLLDPATAAGEPGLATYVEGALATLAWRRGDLAGATAAFQRAYAAALASGQQVSALTLALNIGIAFSTQHLDDSALEWAGRARELLRGRRWPYLQAWSLMQFGSILLGMGRAQAARDLLLQNLPAVEAGDGSRNHVLALQVLGEASLELGEAAAAQRWCEAALQRARRLPYPDLVAGALRYLALARSRLGDAPGALAAAREALAVAEAESDWPRVSTIHHVLAELARQHPGATGASVVAHLQAALEAGARLGSWQPPPAWLAELSAALEAEGDLAGALRREREAAAAQGSAERRRAGEHAAALLARHRTEQAEAEAERQRALAEASRLRAELLETQAALEKERTQSLLVHAGKMVALGRLASGVVHEMSHPVGTLLLLAEALQARLAAGPPEVASTLDTLVGEARRLQQFTGRLRDFARADPPRLARHDLRAVLAEARALIAPRLALARVDYEEAVPALAVEVDPQRLALALANLAFNAADAMAASPQRRLRVHAARAGAELQLHVDDSGPGIAAEALPHLFEPFFTTKPAGLGLGLGLALAAESLAAMRGRLAAANRAEGGARFTIVLPALD